MGKKRTGGGIVYSTDPGFQLTETESTLISLPPGEQKLNVMLDAKNRGGKVVTLVRGYQGLGIEALEKQLKNHCGTVGSVKDGIIIVQGDNREKIKLWLLKNGYQKTT